MTKEEAYALADCMDKEAYFADNGHLALKQGSAALRQLAEQAKGLAEALRDIEADAEYGSVRDSLFEQIMRKARAALARYEANK